METATVVIGPTEVYSNRKGTLLNIYSGISIKRTPLVPRSVCFNEVSALIESSHKNQLSDLEVTPEEKTLWFMSGSL